MEMIKTFNPKEIMQKPQINSDKRGSSQNKNNTVEVKRIS